MFELISDILLMLGALGLASYCMVLSRRLKNLLKSDAGLGATVAKLSARVEDLATEINKATLEAEEISGRLTELISEAERYEGELSFLLAGSETPQENAMHSEEIDQTDVQEDRHSEASVEPIFARRSAGSNR